MEKYEPELDIDDGEAGTLVSFMSHPGFLVWQKVRKAEFQKFFTKLMNTDSVSEDQVLENFRVAKIAAQLYQGETNTLNEIRVQYTSAPRDMDKPVDVTEGILDIGHLASQLEDVPNLLEEVDF